jgi:hypothetical protein
MNQSLYFNIVDPKEPGGRYRPGWVEIPVARTPFIVDRTVWNDNEVSRQASQCVRIYWSNENLCWVLHNRTERVLAVTPVDTSAEKLGPDGMKLLRPLESGGSRYWKCVLDDAFTFVVSYGRPRAGVVRVFGTDHDAMPSKDDPTQPRSRDAQRAMVWLEAEANKIKRHALTLLWRPRIELSLGTPAPDVNTKEIGSAFNRAGSNITEWRELLIKAAYEIPSARDHAAAIRELVMDYHLLNVTDVGLALCYLRRVNPEYLRGKTEWWKHNAYFRRTNPDWF